MLTPLIVMHDEITEGDVSKGWRGQKLVAFHERHSGEVLLVLGSTLRVSNLLDNSSQRKEVSFLPNVRHLKLSAGAFSLYVQTCSPLCGIWNSLFVSQRKAAKFLQKGVQLRGAPPPWSEGGHQQHPGSTVGC